MYQLIFRVFKIDLKGYEDILRHLSDCEINNTKTRVIRNGKFFEIKWSDIAVSINSLVMIGFNFKNYTQ